MNRCCQATLQALQDRLAHTAETLVGIAGSNPTSAMEIAALRRAEIIVDVMTQVKEFANEHK